MDNTRDDKSDKITLRWLHENVPMSWWFWILGIVVVVYSSGVTFSKWDKIQHWFNPNDKELVKTIELTSKPTTEFITSTDRSINNELLTLNQEYNKLTSNYESQIKEQGKLEEKLETLGNENYALTKKLSNLGRKHNELTSNYELQIKEQGKLEGRLEALRKENRLLIVEINGLKNRLESKNISIPKSFEEEDLHKKKNSANDIIQSLSGMYSSHVANFLIEVVPTLKGGVNCDDLATMVNHGYSSHGARVIKKLAPYVQRPFTSDCFEKISSVVYSSEAAGVIQTLMKSEPGY